MKSESEIGTNLTGIGTSPQMAKAMIEASQEVPAFPDGIAAAELRVHYIQEAEPIGTMPPLSDDADMTLDAERTATLLDKLGERLAFERTGARLYELLMTKLEALPDDPNNPSIDDVQRIHDEELAHFDLVARVIDELGADPTAVTPSADLVAVMASGILQVVSDPRTSVAQSLQAMLVAELTDNDGWQLLIELSTDLVPTEALDEMRQALANEKEHLEDVRAWLSDLIVS